MNYNDPIYGSVTFTGLPEAVIENEGMQRLKEVHQNGANFLVNPAMDTSRFEHSLGTAILCRRFGRDEAEVVAALVHDISHTAFSHLADQLYEREDQTFHEDLHRRFVQRYGLDDLVAEHGYDPEYIFDEENFTVLERDRPDICADRLDYTLRDLFKDGRLSRDEVQEVLDGLTVEDGILVARDEPAAKRVMDLFLTLNQEVFFNPLHEASNMLLKDILLDGFKRGVLTEDDLLTTDARVLEKVRTDEDLADRLDSISPDMVVEPGADHDRFEVMRKHRLVDPRVAGTGKRLTDLDPSAKERFETFKVETPLRQQYDIDTGGGDDR